MGYVPTIIDIENYIKELASITNIDINIIKTIVFYNFDRIKEGLVSFTDACNNIEDDLANQIIQPVSLAARR